MTNSNIHNIIRKIATRIKTANINKGDEVYVDDLYIDHYPIRALSIFNKKDTGNRKEGIEITIDVKGLPKTVDSKSVSLVMLKNLLKKWDRFATSLTFNDAVKDVKAIIAKLTPEERPLVRVKAVTKDLTPKDTTPYLVIKSPTVDITFGRSYISAKFKEGYLFTGIYEAAAVTAGGLEHEKAEFIQKIEKFIEKAKRTESALKTITAAEFAKLMRDNNFSYRVSDLKGGKVYKPWEEPWAEQFNKSNKSEAKEVMRKAPWKPPAGFGQRSPAFGGLLNPQIQPVA